jgi:hypothetical protein
MTTRATARIQQQDKPSVRALAGMTALTFALVGGVALWQVRDSGEPAKAPVAVNGGYVAATTAVVESTPVSDQQMYQQWPQRTAVRPSTRPDEDIPADGPLGTILPAPAGVRPMGNASPDAPVLTGYLDDSFAFHVVGSWEEEAALRHQLTSLNRDRSLKGMPELDITIVVVSDSHIDTAVTQRTPPTDASRRPLP